MRFIKPILFACFASSIIAIPLNGFHLEIESRLIANRKDQFNREIEQVKEEEEEGLFFKQFENAEANEFFENLPVYKEELEEEIEDIELNEALLELEEVEEIEKEQANHHHHIPIQPDIEWRRPGNARFYQEIKLKQPTTNKNDTLKLTLFVLVSLVICIVLKYHKPSPPIKLSRN